MLGFLNKSKNPGHCRFPLTNPHEGQIRDYVPYGASPPNPLKELKLLT